MHSVIDQFVFPSECVRLTGAVGVSIDVTTPHRAMVSLKRGFYIL